MKTNLKILLCLALLSMWPGLSSLAETGPVQVTVSILPQTWFVQAVGGPHVEVQVLVGPGHSPATFEPTVKQLAALQVADLFVTAGVPFELGFMPKVRGMKSGPRICGPEAQVGHHDHHHGHDHHHDGELDPHFWLDPTAALQHMELIKAELSLLRPDLEPAFATRLAEARDQLSELQNRMDHWLTPHAGQAFFVFHPSFGHLARRYDLEQVAVEDGGNQPGPRQLAQVIERARQTGARAIIVQPQFSKKSAQVVAEAAGLEVAELDPLNPDYLANMEHMARRLAEVLAAPERDGP